MLDLLELFTSHPKSVGMTYQEHMYGSLNFSKELFIASLKAFTHAIFPFLYKTSTTDVVKKIQEEMEKIHND